MRYEIIEVKFEDGKQDFMVVDTAFEIQVAVLDTWKDAVAFRQQRESVDKVNSE